MVFVDANIPLELLLPGRPKRELVQDYLLSQTSISITTLTVHLLFHFCRQSMVVDDQLIHELISEYRVIDLRKTDYVWARDNEAGRDFEDALQVAAAIRSGCSEVATLDKDLAKNYQKFIPCVVP